jgi:hypothetical protein
MIKLESQTFEQSLARWNQYIAAKAEMLHLPAPKVLEKEGGRLVQTLIKLSPPLNRAGSMEKLGERAARTFHTLGEDKGHDFVALDSPKAGRGDVRWYAFQDNAIFGVAKDADKTSATDEEIYKLFLGTKLNEQGRIIAGQRGKQTIYIWQKVTTTAAQVKRLIARLKEHYGRLKAGFLPAWESLGSPGGEYAPPGWVTKHQDGARGDKENRLKDRANPSFTIINFAKGATAIRGLAAAAMKVRAQAMVNRMTFLLKHPEKVSEET